MSNYEYPNTLAAAKRAKGAEWALADAIVEDIGERGSEADFKDCADYLAGFGIEYQPSYLRSLHQVARKFGPADRSVPPGTASRAGTPEAVEAAVEIKKAKAEELGVDYHPPTQREIVTARKSVTHHQRKAKGQRIMPEPTTTKPPKPTVTELRRTTNIMGLLGLVRHAASDGRSFVEGIAGSELSDEEREDFEAEIEKVLETWRAARTAVRNPLSKSIDAFLDSL